MAKTEFLSCDYSESLRNHALPEALPAHRKLDFFITLLIVYQNLFVSVQDGHAALHAAAYQGHLKVVEMLLKANADANIKAKVRY